MCSPNPFNTQMYINQIKISLPFTLTGKKKLKSLNKQNRQQKSIKSQVFFSDKLQVHVFHYSLYNAINLL